MFRSYLDHLQGAHMFLVKVNYFKIFKNVKVNVVMGEHNIWCEDVCSPDCSADCTHLHTERTYTHQMFCCRITPLAFTFLTNFKISNFNKEHMSSLQMI